jgi:hypothetical protein
MDKDTSYILGVLLGLFIISYEPPHKVAFFLSRFYYKLVHMVNHYNHLFYNKYLNQAKIQDQDQGQDQDQDQDQEKEAIKSKYEDKYLAEIRKLEKEFVFTDDEEIIKLQKFNEFLTTSNESYTVKIEEIKDKLNFIEIELAKYELEEETGKQDQNLDGDVDEDNEDDDYVAETKEERLKSLNNNNTQLVEELNILTYFIDTAEGQEELRMQAQEQSKQYIIDQRLEKLKNCFVMESTPLGNVLMIYDKERNSFKYYSDNSIPYRYLEVVARKYVKQFSCRPVFVDMEEELKLAEEKWDQEKKEKEEKAEDEKKRKEEAIKNNTVLIEEKKNVFAKFKQYNKTAGTGHVSKAAPPKNSIPNKSFTEKRENEKILLKDKANRYTYEGKLANFSFLKKVNRKAVNKKFAMTFADFKKLQTKS